MHVVFEALLERFAVLAHVLRVDRDVQVSLVALIGGHREVTFDLIATLTVYIVLHIEYRLLNQIINISSCKTLDDL